MTEYELLTLIHGGENIRVEFKKSTNEITRDVYDTVCSFSNRDGGIIILGVKDNGEILGIIPDAVDRMKKDFVTSINNGQKINPPLYLQPETYQIEGRTLLVIQVPVSSQVCRHRGRIFDRNHESDIDITDNSDMVYQLYARKSGSYFVNKVTRFQLSDLRSDLIERARTMTSSRTANFSGQRIIYFAQNYGLAFPNILVSMMKLRLVIKIELTKTFERHIIIYG